MDIDLKDRVAFVTGAAGAIGTATVNRLAACGAAVVVADVNEAGAKALAATLPRALALTLDIRDEAATERAVEETLKEFGRLDILINNAGVNTFKHRVDIDAFPSDEWRRIVGVDLDGLYLMSKAAAKPMIAQNYGRIVNVASVVGYRAMRLQSPFVAAKAAVIHLTRSMALELGPKGILVNAIAPGSVMTEGTRQLFYGDKGAFRAQSEAFMRHIPLGRPALVEEIAEGMLFLCAEENSYMAGHLLMVDGGWTAGFMF
jgi:NAD(P)-dependent dehydrogenase (short-subunit alcohol dehydrogenase family)